MDQPYQAASDVYVLPTHLPLPGAGVIIVNAFVILAKEPVLVDTGLGMDRAEFLNALRSVIDPSDLRWIWLTHDDGDHTGSLREILEVAPQARLATNAIAALRMFTAWPVPLDRVQAMSPGDTIDAGDRILTAIRPPLFDNPMSTGLYDGRTGALFTVDSFGALLPEPAQDAADIAEDDLARGLVAWATLDSPWAHLADDGKFDEVLGRVRHLAPTMIFSSHLPPARGSTERLLQVVASVPKAEPFVFPNQATFQEMLAQMFEADASVSVGS